jgi:vancomycin permeability regulator SanA
MKRRLLKCLFILILLACGGAALLIGNGLHDRLGPADVCLVLGNAVYKDGRPSNRLKARLDKAAELYKQGLFAHVLVSGGVYHRNAPEGTAMKAYLVRQGIPEGAILVDNEGADTRSSARNTAALLKARGWTSVLAVTQYFHIPRTRLALRQEGIPTVYSAHADYLEQRDLYSIVRELAGYPAYFFRLK